MKSGASRLGTGCLAGFRRGLLGFGISTYEP